PSAQRFGRVVLAVAWWPVDATSLFVEHDGVEVDLAVGRVHHREVPQPRVVAVCWPEASASERAGDRVEVAGLQDDVEVGVAPGLMAETRVDSPASVDPDVDAERTKEVEKLANVVSGRLSHRHAPGTIRLGRRHDRARTAGCC